jgi:hypothetical protein
MYVCVWLASNVLRWHAQNVSMITLNLVTAGLQLPTDPGWGPLHGQLLSVATVCADALINVEGHR